MQDALDIFLLEPFDAAAHNAAQQALLRDDPALAEALAQWQAMLAHVQTEVASWPRRHLLVLYALQQSGHARVLDAVDTAQLANASASLGAALEAHPALQTLIASIQKQADAFEAAWQVYQGEIEAVIPPTPPQPEAKPTVRTPRPARVPRRPKRSLQRWGWRIGATAAVLAFAFVLNTLLQREQARVTLTAYTQAERIVLADGSTVRLMPGSSLTFADGDVFDRNVRLEGQAFFSVVRDARIFTVETATAVTTVLGTEFGVTAGDDLTEVTLVSGKVALAPQGATQQIVLLNPGEASRVARNALPSTPTSVDLASALAWTGQFVFRATPLPTLAERLAIHYAVPVQLDPTLPADSINGTFDHSEALGDILDQIAASIGIEVETLEAGGFRLIPTE